MGGQLCVCVCVCARERERERERETERETERERERERERESTFEAALADHTSFAAASDCSCVGEWREGGGGGGRCVCVWGGCLGALGGWVPIILTGLAPFKCNKGAKRCRYFGGGRCVCVGGGGSDLGKMIEWESGAGTIFDEPSSDDDPSLSSTSLRRRCCRGGGGG